MSLGRLLVTTPSRSIDYEVVSPTVNVGRSPDGNQLVLDDAEVSRWHCRFEFGKKGICRIVDLQSANGTNINEKSVVSEDGVVVRNDDVIFVGMSQIKFVAPPQRKKKEIEKKEREPLRQVSSEEAKNPPSSKKKNPVAPSSKKKKKRTSRLAEKPQRLSKGGSCLSNIQEIAERRKNRREQQRRKHALAQEKRSSLGSDKDLTFVQMVDEWRISNMQRTGEKCREFVVAPNAKIRVCVRKRPMNKTEAKRDSDVCTCIMTRKQQNLVVHEPKKRVDLTTYVENHEFQFDQVFDEKSTNEDVYLATTYPLLRHVFDGFNATVFAYGQTGSGKTFTMAGESDVLGVNHQVAQDLFLLLDRENREDVLVFASYFEIYGGQVYDLLNERHLLRVMENRKRKVCVTGLKEMKMTCPEDILEALEMGNTLRATGATSANDRSSRSHAIFQILLRHPGKYRNPLHGKLSLVDLAGSERGADTAHSDRRTRIEGAQINKSLLALKECIRALSNAKRHKPFRASKLTQVLKDSFVGNSKTVMIATVSPASLNAEHTCNTLRYASRVKDISSGPVGSMIPFSELRKLSRSKKHQYGKKKKIEEEEEDEELQEYDDEDDLEVLQRSLDDRDYVEEKDHQEEEKSGDGLSKKKDMFEYSMAVSRLVSAESRLVQAHEDMFKVQKEVAAEEQKLFRIASTGAKGHDSEVYARRLDEILKMKMLAMKRVQDCVLVVQDLLRKEEEMAEGKVK